MNPFSSDIAPDLVVVGAGLAGLTAANCAADAGLRVLVLERGEEDGYLCNTRYCGGLFHIAMDDILAPSETVRANLVRATGGDVDAELADALVGHAARAMQTLKRFGVRFIAAGPDGVRRNSLAPPIVRQPGLNWRGRAGDVMLRTLGEALARRKGRIERGTAVSALLLEQGRCAGVVACAAGRPDHPIRARAVVLADGGFQSNADLVRRYIAPVPEALLQRNARSGHGSALVMAERVGASLVRLDRFYGHVQHRSAMTNERLWPYPVLDPVASTGIVVDGAGRRFCDEGGGGVHIANAIARLADPLSASVIFDQAIWEGPGRDGLLPVNPNLVRAGGEVISAGSLPDLASRLGLAADVLAATVDAYNRTLEGDPVPGAPPRTFGARRWPIARAPFFAIPACVGITYTMGGIATDGRARVRHRDGGLIPGLFAAGACTGGLEGGGHTGYAGGLSKAAVFGMLAGETAAAEMQAVSR